MRNKEILSSVINAMRILRLYNHKQRELSFTEITEKLALTKGTASRLISTMVKKGFLTKNPKTNHYRLGLAILSLGGIIFSHHELYKEAIPIVKNLSEVLEESVHICLMENNKVVYLFRNESKHPDRLVTQMGRTGPLHCTSEGLCILAFQTEHFIRAFLNRPLFAYTVNTITDHDRLYNHLLTIRKDDYCLLESTYYENYTSIATPIRNYNEDVVASLSVIGHSSRFTTHNIDDIITKMKKASYQISEHLGYVQ